ncbi:MAG: phage scaffolding protein [Bacillota bacterium]
MKTEFLKDLGLEQDAIDKIMAENGKDIETTKAKFSDYDTLKTKLTEANKTIEGFKAMDIEGIKRAADDWKAKAEQAEKDATAKIADMEFNGLLDSAINTAKGRNAKALRGLLDIDTLKASKNQSEDIKAALEALKASDGYLFDTQPASRFTTRTDGAKETMTTTETAKANDALRSFFRGE